MSFRLPNDTERFAGIGKNGTGKTQAALWQLSERDYDSKPWYIFDFKRDALINSIAGAKHLSLTHDSKPETEPGLYVFHPHVEDDEVVDNFLSKIWEHENSGVFIDEGYMIPNSANLNACLTQGRSKKIPMIILTQRPTKVSRFVFSEADHFQFFWCNDERDRKILKGYFPESVNLDKRLPPFHSLWYNAKSDEIHTLGPVPDERSILDRFNERLRILEQPKVSAVRRHRFV